MAEVNLELERMARLLEVANEELIRNGKISKETQEAIVDAQMKAKYGIENFTKVTKTAGEALGSLAGVGIQSAKAIYEGKKGMSAFNSGLDELAKAATLAGTALTLLVPGGIVMKAVIGGLTMAATAAIAYTKAANEMADKLYKGYEGLQKSGAAAADGMTGLYRDAKKLGLGMNELDSFVGLVAENSQTLALFSGSVSDGRKKFANMGKALEGSREEFFRLGISQQEQNEGMMRYVKNMTLAGRAQNMTTKELAEGARAYIYEQDKLTKLTGISAQKQQSILDRARESEQFNAKIRSLELKGDKESLAAADRLRKGLIMASAAGDGVAEGFMASVNGNLRNQKAQELFTSSYGANLTAVSDILAGADPEKALMPMFKAIAEFERTQGNQLSMLEAGNGKFLKSSEQANAALIAEIGYDKYMEKIRLDQLAAQKGMGDKLTKEQAAQLLKQQRTQAKLEEGVFQGIANAQANMDSLADATDSLADSFVNLTKGLNWLLKKIGLGEKEDKVAEKKQEILTTEAELKKARIAEKTAKTPEEKAAAERGVKFYTEKLALLSKEKDTIAKEEENKAYEAEVLKRADDEVKLKQAAYEKAMETATATQKAGFGLEIDQKKAQKELWEAVGRQRQLRGGRGTFGSDKTRAAAVEELKKSGYKPPSQQSEQVNPAEAGRHEAVVGGPEGETPPTSAGTGASKIKLSQVTSKSGKSASVNQEYAPKFQALIDYLDSVGYEINSLGGYVDRDVRGKPGVKSIHAHGAAIDINPGTNPMGSQLVTDMPEEIGKVAGDLGLGWGGNWKRVKDAMHFSVAESEGGTIKLEKGGVVSGPNSGYPVIAHGDEAMIPLNNGAGNFVRVFEDMAMMMSQQARAMDELIRVAKNSNDIQTKILRMQS